MAIKGEGSDDTYARAASALVTAPPFTVFGWFLHTSGHGTETLWGTVDVSVTDHYFTVQSGTGDGDRIRSRAGDGTTSNAGPTNTYSDDVWNSFTGIFTAVDDRRCILNGDWANSTQSTTSRTPANLDRTTLGKLDYSSGGGTQGHTGDLGDYAIWDVALVQAEVEALHDGADPRRIRPESLIHFWPLFDVADMTDRRSGTTLTAGSALATGDHHGKIWRPTSQLAIGVTPSVAAPAPDDAVRPLESQERHYPRGVLRGVMRGAISLFSEIVNLLGTYGRRTRNSSISNL